MKVNTGKGCFDDYLTAEERAKHDAAFQQKVRRRPKPVKKPKRKKK